MAKAPRRAARPKPQTVIAGQRLAIVPSPVRVKILSLSREGARQQPHAVTQKNASENEISAEIRAPETQGAPRDRKRDRTWRGSGRPRCGEPATRLLKRTPIPHGRSRALAGIQPRRRDWTRRTGGERLLWQRVPGVRVVRMHRGDGIPDGPPSHPRASPNHPIPKTRTSHLSLISPCTTGRSTGTSSPSTRDAPASGNRQPLSSWRHDSGASKPCATSRPLQRLQRLQRLSAGPNSTLTNEIQNHHSFYP